MKFFSNDLVEFILVPDVERIAASVELIGESSEGPYVDFLIVLFSHQNFRRKVERCSAESFSKLAKIFVAEVGLPKITYLWKTLNIISST
jgi:hypothetical protein